MGKTTTDPRQRLLDAGLKLFANRGYAGTAVQDITEEAKVTKPTLYYYFENKEGLFQALVDQAMDERLRLMRQAAPPEKATVNQLTDIIAALTDFAHRQPDLLRLTFAVAFAAEGEYPSGFKKHAKMHASFQFISSIIQDGARSRRFESRLQRYVELTQSYFQLVQHSIVLTIIEPKFRRLKPPIPLPPRMKPKRIVELFLGGAAGLKAFSANGAPSKRASRLTKALAIMAGFGVSLLGAKRPDERSLPFHKRATDRRRALRRLPPDTNTAVTNSAPVLPDVRPIPLAVKASHPELATVSPIAQNAHDPHALDLQTCFQLTAIRDDSLKISMDDVEIARAQMSQSNAALWPTFYREQSAAVFALPNPALGGFSILGNSTITGNRNYTSQSHVAMTYTLFNGGQNWNNVGASSAAVAAKRQTLARNYQTIYQDVAQAFYNVLQFDGDMVIEADLIDALKARVDDLKDRVNLGRSRPSELLQAQTDLANAKVTYESQRGSLNAAKETVAFYIGVPPSGFALKETQKFPSAAQLEAYVKESGTRPGRAFATGKPAAGRAESFRGGGPAFAHDHRQRRLSCLTGPGLQPDRRYHDAGSLHAHFRRRPHCGTNSPEPTNWSAKAGSMWSNLKRTADQDTRTAYANFNASIAQVVVLREAATLAAKDFEAQVDDYRRGVVANLDVLTALQDYQDRADPVAQFEHAGAARPDQPARRGGHGGYRAGRKQPGAAETGRDGAVA